MRATGLIALGACCLSWFAAAAVGDDIAVDDQQPVMISLADREAPSDEEWEALHEDTQRAGLFGSLGDLKSQTISFMDTQYFTANSAEGTLAAFGKMEKNRFDRYGHIANVEFDVPRNTWKERYALNAAALVKLTGKARFVEFAGVELDTAVQDRRQIEVTFVGTMVPKDEAIRQLNADVEALTYLATIHDKHQQQSKGFKLFGKSAAPKPKVVLANVVMFDGKSSQMLEGNLHGRAESVLHGLGGELKLVKSGGEEITLLTPVVRCYRTYSIEFHTDANGQLATTLRTDRTGRQHRVPTVFDLTPDL